MAGEEMTSLTVSSYIRGYHAYMHAWEPFIGEVLPLQREPDNPEDRFAVAVQKSGEVVGHIIRTVVRIVGMGRMSHICNTKCSRL